MLSLPFCANDANRRSNRQHLISFVRRPRMGRNTLPFPSPLIQWLGGSKWSMTKNTSALNISGRNKIPPRTRSRELTDLHHSFFCENTEWAWVVGGWSKDNGANVRSSLVPSAVTEAAYFNSQMHLWTQQADREPDPVFMWKLIPVETMDQGFPPSYEGDGFGQSSTSAQHAESESDDFGTVVTEVTTVTTRRNYRVESA